MIELAIFAIFAVAYITASGVAKGYADAKGWNEMGWMGAFLWPFMLFLAVGIGAAKRGTQIGAMVAVKFDPASALTGGTDTPPLTASPTSPSTTNGKVGKSGLPMVP